jgi:hypothetical protein
MKTAKELLALAAQSGNPQLVLDSTWQFYFELSPTGEVTIKDGHAMPEGTVKHPSIDASEEEVLYQMARGA